MPAVGSRACMPSACFRPCIGYSMHDPRVERGARAGGRLTGRAVFVHCGVLTVGVRKKLGLPSPFDMRYSNPLDLHAVALRYPRSALRRAAFRRGLFSRGPDAGRPLPNVYLDTSSSNSWMRYEGLDLTTVFRRALSVVGPGRLLFGTDSSFFPRGWNREIFEKQTAVLSELGIGGADARAILGGNLRRILTEF